MDSSISSSLTTCLIFVFIVTATTAQNTVCPFNYLYHFGDGVFDNGNAITRSVGLPAASLPYGVTFPGSPTGRWSDGFLDIDYGAHGLGFPDITPYLSENSSSANAIMFAVARSPVLDSTFFLPKGINIPTYAASLRLQLNWFNKYLISSFSSPQDRNNRVANALFLFGDVEANDITYALLQGKSIEEARSYIADIIRAQIKAAKDVIRMGATRVILPGSAPMGCYPFILTGLASSNPEDYDVMGCLKRVNELIVSKNNDLQKAIGNLSREFPNTFIRYADFFNTEQSLIRETIITNASIALQTCCGIGGSYNYDEARVCGTEGVPVCPDPNQYFFWDGIHLTQEANHRLSTVLAAAALPTLGCIS